MSTLTKTLLAVMVGILVGGAAYVMAAPGDNTSSTATQAEGMTSTTGATGATGATGDVSGPCDEAEHANDPRCAGPQRPEDNHGNDNVGNGQTTTTDDGPGHDAGDDNPGRHGNRGHGSQNSGPGSQNSGRGSSHSDDGPAHDVGDDHGGHGADDGVAHDVGDDNGGHGADDGAGHDVGDDHGGGSGSSGSGSGHSGGSDD